MHDELPAERRRHQIRLRETDPIHHWWDHFVEAWHVIRPAWWTVITTLVVCFLLLAEAQTRDLLAAMRVFPSESAEAVGVSGRFWTALTACAVYAFCAWVFTRGLLAVRFPFTPAPLDPPDWQVSMRIWMARVLGILVPLCAARAYYGLGLPVEGSIYLGLSFFLLLLFIFFKPFLRNWIYDPDAKPKRKEEHTLREHMAEWWDYTVKEVTGREIFDREMPAELPPKLKYLLFGILILHALVALTFAFSPVFAPRAVGAAAILFLATAGVLSFGVFVFTYWPRQHRLPPAIMLWAVVLTLSSLFNDNHFLGTPQVMEAQAAENDSVDAPASMPIEQYAEDWLTARQDYLPKGPGDAEFPIYFVAAEGGGVRAAYWTGTVLATLDLGETAMGLKPRDHMFLVSGVSGGSFGSAAFAASVVETPDRVMETVDTYLKQDHLSPVTAGLLYPDLLTDFIPVAMPYFDRARWLEASWRLGWNQVTGGDAFDRDFRTLWQGDAPAPGSLGAAPMTIYNTTSVSTGEIWAISYVRLGDEPGCRSGDFVDLMDPQGDGLSLAAAAHLSARFTGISPAGRLEFPEGLCPGRTFDRFVDGAYYENSGATSATTAMRVMKDVRDRWCAEGNRCDASRMPVVPIVIVSELPAPKNPPRVLHESFSPPVAFMNTRGARGRAAVADFARVGEEPLQRIELATGWYRHEEALGCTPVETSEINPRETTRYRRRVPLGWTLSNEATDHMCRQRLQSEPLKQLRDRLGTAPERQAFLQD
ncbi:hypothetical protein FF098_010610 [Parvularcula flava]|uniref:PNPLA domain-containing protein n=1 Tax=Aquisalinus luteolus TaxID=1566827 RepID=A0A8J3A473_9PROT|nr:hypothetical protein [Aquisalinus luteolus]NHK28356.1 hypothetical protein [Aquisalinus luteolus]GGH98229.1 hypothetical protein GCM10011355_21330 [Aquisalinus luteolus]